MQAKGFDLIARQGADTSQLTCLALVLPPDHFTLVGRAQEWRDIQWTFGQLRQLDELDFARGHPDLIGKRPHKAEEAQHTQVIVTTGTRIPGNRRGNRQPMDGQKSPISGIKERKRRLVGSKIIGYGANL